MVGYVQTCARCGKQMLVPARLLGRDLRCTGCGTPFAAQLPVSA
jgi:DNA-directed RNA polymerase subunit RPC12/RpoP